MLLTFAFVPSAFSAQALLKNARAAASAVNGVNGISIVDMTTSHTASECGRYQSLNGVKRRFFNGYDGMWIERFDGRWVNVDGVEASQDKRFSWCDHMGSGKGAIFEDIAAAAVVALEGRAGA